ncbi:MAG TPA: hypothetical protein VK158_05800 [Acidobacteriota bacterium]|nr:hypothetical protein [Acidobacteriota bacterium]
MKFRWSLLVAVLLTACIALLRINASTAVPFFSDDISYDYLSQISTFEQTKSLTYDNENVFHGERMIMHPVAIPFLWLFYAKQNTIFWYKISLNIIASLVTFVIFLLSYELSKSSSVSIGAAIISGVNPLWLFVSINSISTMPLFILLVTCGLYFLLLHAKRKKKRWVLIGTIFWSIACLLTPLFGIVALGLIIYLAYAALVNQKVPEIHLELTLFFVLLCSVFNYILYSKAFVVNGLLALQAYASYLPYTSFKAILPFLPQLGILIIACAIYTINKAFSSDVKFRLYVLLCTGIGSASLAMMLLSSIPTEQGLVIISLVAIILTVVFFQELLTYLQNTKLAHHAKTITGIALLIIILSAAIPAYFYTISVLSQSTNAHVVSAYTWLKANTPKDALLITPVYEAHTSQYFAQRQTLMDSHNTARTDAKTRYKVLQSVYKTPYTAAVKEQLHSLGIRGDVYFIFTKEFTQTLTDKRLPLYARSDGFITVYSSADVTVVKTII